MDFFSLIIIGFVLLSVIGSVRQKSGLRGSAPNRRPYRANSAGDDGRFDRSAQRANSVGDDGRLDRGSQRMNSVGEQGGFDRSAQRANSVGDTPARSRRQRMVEEQRARAEAYRRGQSAPAKPRQDRPKAAAAPLPACSNCGRLLKEGDRFCPDCGRQLTPEEIVYSYSDGDQPPTEVSPALKPNPKPRPAVDLPGFSGPELTRALVMAEILGPCKARQHH